PFFILLFPFNYSALGSLSKPIFLCVPSQNGLFEERPHLQRLTAFFVSNTFHSLSTTSKFPVTTSAPLSFTLIFIFSFPSIDIPSLLFFPSSIYTLQLTGKLVFYCKMYGTHLSFECSHRNHSEWKSQHRLEILLVFSLSRTHPPQQRLPFREACSLLLEQLGMLRLHLSLHQASYPNPRSVLSQVVVAPFGDQVL